MTRKSLINTTCALVAGAAAAFAQPGRSGMAFLKLGVSGRSTAMADAGGAAAYGAAATYYNPAGLLNVDGSASVGQLMFMHREWIQDTRMEFLGAALPLGEDNALGISVNSTTVADIEVRTRPGPADGTFTARQAAAGLSFAHRIAPDLCAGVTAKFLYQKIFVDEGSGFGADVGVVWSSPLDSLTLGGALCNLGSMGVLRNEKTTLPALLRVGPAYALPLGSDQIASSIAADAVSIIPEHRTYLNVGGELIIDRFVAARGGYQFGSEGRGLTLGVGIAYGKFALDYAYARISAGLGDAHTISLGLTL